MVALEPEPQNPAPSASKARDTAIGVFTDDGPWEVDLDALEWRHGLAGLRADLNAALPGLTRARSLPPGRRLGTTLQHLGGALGLWYAKERRAGGPTSIAGISRRLRVAAEQLGPTYIKLGQIVAIKFLPESISTDANTEWMGRPSSSVSTRSTTRHGSAGTSSRHHLNSATSSGGKTPSPEATICPSFM